MLQYPNKTSEDAYVGLAWYEMALFSQIPVNGPTDSEG